MNVEVQMPLQTADFIFFPYIPDRDCQIIQYLFIYLLFWWKNSILFFIIAVLTCIAFKSVLSYVLSTSKVC